MGDTEDWRNFYRNYLIADTSRPRRVPEEYNSTDHQIKLFTELCGDMTDADSIQLIIRSILVPFNYVHGQRFNYYDYNGNKLMI